MRNVRETYDLPERPPPAYRQWALMLAVPVIVIALWLLLPKSPVAVIILGVVTLAVVFLGVQRVLSSRQLHQPPGHNPAPPRD